MKRGKALLALFWEFFQFGCFTFGGGWSIVAQMQRLYVEKRKTITGEELLDITSGFNGGTVPNFIGYMTSKGLKWICPVGYDKLVPSVPAASRALGGASHIDISLGADPGMYCLSSADIVTEAEAIRMMFRCEAKVVCASGIGGNEGAHYWAVDGEEADIMALVDYLERNVKGEPAIPGNKGNCANCRYPGCKYNGKPLPDWMKRRGIEK